MALAAMIYPPQQYNHQQYQQQEQLLSSVDPTQLLVGMAAAVFPSRHSPVALASRPQPQKSKMKKSTTNNGKNATKSSKSKTNSDHSNNNAKNTKKKRQQKQQGNKTNERTATTGRGALTNASAKKPRRRRYDNDFKADVLDHLKVPHVKLADVAKRYSIPENTLREWTKVKCVRAIETARSGNSGQLKANMNDPMRRLTETMMVFFEDNKRQPERLRQAITTKLVVAKVCTVHS